MAARRTRRDPNSRTAVTLPEGALSDALLDLARPLLEKLSPDSSTDRRRAIERTVAFWNAHVLASKQWEHPRMKPLNELKKRLRGPQASPEDVATFDALTEGWRAHWLDPRLVESWSYEPDDQGVWRLTCVVGLPEGVEVATPPPVEKRIAIGGVFLDEVRISMGGNTFLGFPVDRHRAVIAEDGNATIHAMMPSALQLFAEGRLPRVGGAVEVEIGGRKLGPMVLAAVRSGGEGSRHDVAVLVFKPT